MPKRKRSPLHDTINPLSHNETTIKQLHVAGLTENDLLPSTYIPGFPHRPIRSSHLPQDEDVSTSPTKHKEEHRRSLATQRSRDAQEQHLGVLVALILRSLDQDDIPRAKRAFGLVWRTQVRGKPVDLRRQSLWTLGAEILMREGEGEGEKKTTTTPGKRWGATGNMPQLRAYLECLIRQYPYNRLHPTSISDLDFYPVLFGCEVYDVWVEHKLALERLDTDAETWSDDNNIRFDPDDPLSTRERHLRDEKVRLRTQALAMMRGLAARMDTLMENAPYNRSVEMLRLRGMVALYVGDLSMPPWPRTEPEDERGKTMREEEQTKAKAFFTKMRDQTNGSVDGRVHRWIQDEDDAYKDDEDSDDGFGLPIFSSLPIR